MRAGWPIHAICPRTATLRCTRPRNSLERAGGTVRLCTARPGPDVSSRSFAFSARAGAAPVVARHSAAAVAVIRHPQRLENFRSTSGLGPVRGVSAAVSPIGSRATAKRLRNVVGFSSAPTTKPRAPMSAIVCLHNGMYSACRSIAFDPCEPTGQLDRSPTKPRTSPGPTHRPMLSRSTRASPNFRIHTLLRGHSASAKKSATQRPYVCTKSDRRGHVADGQSNRSRSAARPIRRR